MAEAGVLHALFEFLMAHQAQIAPSNYGDGLQVLQGLFEGELAVSVSFPRGLLCASIPPGIEAIRGKMERYSIALFRVIYIFYYSHLFVHGMAYPRFMTLSGESSQGRRPC
jgi:hypothetical protein